jgi:hypothetical protein
MLSRPHAFALAGVLTATTLTGSFAIIGIAHHPTTAKPAPIVQIATPAAQTWADD